MIFLILAITAMSCMMLDLKFLNIKGISIPQVVMTNYTLALAIALFSSGGIFSWSEVDGLLNGEAANSLQEGMAGGLQSGSAGGWQDGSAGIFSNDWWYRAVVVGILYFVSMDLMAASTRVAGVAVTTIAARASLIVPILWAFLFFGEPVTAWQWAGIVMVMAAFVIIFSRGRKDIGSLLRTGSGLVSAYAYVSGSGSASGPGPGKTNIILSSKDISSGNKSGKPRHSDVEVSCVEVPRHNISWQSDRRRWLGPVLMPLGVFVALGIISAGMKSAQHIIGQGGNYSGDYPVFNTLLFASALVSAVIYYAVSKGRKAFKFSAKSLFGGLVLGACNYLVTLGIMYALRTMPTSLFYTLYNISVVVIITLAGVLLFRERLGWRKTSGIVLAVAAIATLSLLG